MVDLIQTVDFWDGEFWRVLATWHAVTFLFSFLKIPLYIFQIYSVFISKVLQDFINKETILLRTRHELHVISYVAFQVAQQAQSPCE